MKQEQKADLRSCDWVAGISLFMLFGTRFLTNIYLAMVTKETQQTVAVVNKLYEMNPLFKYAFDFSQMSNILQYLIVPAFMFTVYWVFRRRVVQERLNVENLVIFTVFTFLLCLANFLNDLSAVLGKLWG